MGVKLDLISDIDMYHFIEKSMRGWICYVGKRYSKASNKYMESYIKASNSFEKDFFKFMNNSVW